MKIKRILSLALSAVLAVSMLTACGGTVGVPGKVISDETTAVRRAMNMELDTLAQDTVAYKGNAKLSQAAAAVAGTLTVSEAEQTSKVGKVVNSSAQAMMGRYITYDKWISSFEAYKAEDKDSTIATALLLDGDMTAEEVGKAMAANVAKWKLDDVDAKSYAFDGSIAAFKVTIKAADEKSKDTSVWFVGLMLEQTKVKA